MGRSSILFGAATFLFSHYVIAYTTPLNSTDQSALLALKSSITFGSDDVFLNKNWTAESSVCDWTGVFCGSPHNRVVSLNISAMKLSGSIPPDVGNLSFLSSLDMSYNNFHGNLPEELSRLHNLEYLNLESNNFSGTIPSSIFSSLSQLQVLFLSQNSFSGSIPSSVSNMSRLEVLYLDRNFLAGSIPEEIGDLRFLKTLDLESNRLSGRIPTGVFNLSLLEYIGLTTNNISGNLPADVCTNLPMLKGLFLAENELNGPILASLRRCYQLEVLSLSENSFTGNIPREIGNLTMLVHLDIGYNNLEGAIPAEIGNVQGLETLHVYENWLSGSIPGIIFNISTLQVFQCAKNLLSGNLPSIIGHGVPNLRELNLGLNNLSGIIPDSISNASQLTFLSLAYNGFTGSIPDTLGNLRSLKILYLGENNLKMDLSSSDLLGVISSLTKCRNLTVLSISGNHCNGVLPASIGNSFTALKIFEASRCKIWGAMPEAIGNLSSVVRLNLYGNDISGAIPRTVGGLLSLQELFLDHNQIGGSLPETICNLPNLGALFLGTNRISGHVPTCIGNNTSLRYLYLDSNNFSSSLPENLCALKDLLIFDAPSNQLSGFLPPEIGNLRAIIEMDLSMNGFIGNIPTTVGGLQSLIYFNLSQNELEGSIPDSFGQMLSLETLDLSQNKLTGTIPQSLESLLYLKLFNVSFNELSGQIPTGGPFQNFTSSSFLSNGALCGAPQFDVLPCPIIRPHRKYKKLLVILCIFLGFFPIPGFAILFMRWRKKKAATLCKVISPPMEHGSISYHELETITNGFSEGNLLAVGSYSAVYKGMLSDAMHSAVKVFNFKSAGALKSFNREYQVLSNLRHRNLIKVITSCTAPDLYFGALVLEYMPNGSLEKWLYSHNNFLDMSQRLGIMIDVASALDYLHNEYFLPVVHCDVKPSNVLLDADMVGHVCDFGISKLLGVGDEISRRRTLGTMGYIAPEYGTEGIVSTKCDVYSYGIMLMETFTRTRPIDDKFTGDMTLRNWIKDSFPNTIMRIVDCNLLKREEADFEANRQCVSSIMELALHCTETSPDARMKMHDVLPVLKRLRSELLNFLNFPNASFKHRP